MSAAAAVIVAALALGAVALALAIRERQRGLQRLVKERVVVHTNRPDDQSIRGVCEHVARDCVVLTAPEWLESAQPEPAPGRAVVLKRNVSSIQILEG